MKVGPSGKRPEKFLENGLLASRPNIRRAIYEIKRAHKKMRRFVEYAYTEHHGENGRVTRIFTKDKEGNRIPVRVLHETKGWQSARIGGLA